MRPPSPCLKISGKAYNPLFIYGPVGIGKTHLMQSVGHRVLQRDPKARVLYVTAQQFMTEVIELACRPETANPAGTVSRSRPFVGR
jgi:chromosomal replication initiator protein